MTKNVVHHHFVSMRIVTSVPNSSL